MKTNGLKFIWEFYMQMLVEKCNHTDQNKFAIFGFC